MNWRRDRLPTPVFLGFPCGSAGKESTHNVGDLGSIHGLERSPGEGKSYPLQYSGPENSKDCIVHGVAKSWTLNNFHFHFLGFLWKVLVFLCLSSAKLLMNIETHTHSKGKQFTGFFSKSFFLNYLFILIGG